MKRVEGIIEKTVESTLKKLTEKYGNIDNTDRYYFKRTEKLLYDYPNLKSSLEQKELDIKDIQEEGRKRRSTSIVFMSAGSKNNSEDEEELLIEEYKSKKERTERLVRKIDRALENIKNDDGYRIIELKYFQNMSIEKIAEEIHCSPATVSRWKNRLINKLKVILFGAEAINFD